MRKLIFLGAIILFAGFGCTHQENTTSSQPNGDSGQPMEHSAGSSEAEGFCDKSPGRGSVHSSFAKMKDFVHEIERHPRSLSPAQCLAVSAYAKTFDWFGEACDERSADEAATWLMGCYKDEWIAGSNSTRLDCQLLGRHDDGMFQSISIQKEYLVNNFSDCEWSNRRLHKLMTAELIKEAVLLLSNPAE